MKEIPCRPWNGLGSVIGDLTEGQKILFEDVRCRLEAEIQKDHYLSEKYFADLIGVDPKTLKNDRAPSGAGRYPVGIRFGGSHRMRYARLDVHDWLAFEELKARTCRVHRCR